MNQNLKCVNCDNQLECTNIIHYRCNNQSCFYKTSISFKPESIVSLAYKICLSRNKIKYFLFSYLGAKYNTTSISKIIEDYDCGCTDELYPLDSLIEIPKGLPIYKIFARKPMTLVVG